jgi:Protein of unknown function (DUF2840)
MLGSAQKIDPPTGDALAFTEVDIAWYEGRIEHWIRFGLEADERIIDRRRRVVCFAPGAVFAVVRWTSNDYGTAHSAIAILRAVGAGEPYSTEPLVRPGAEILLRLASWRRVQRVLQAIDIVEALGVQAHDAAPDHWRHIHNRLSAGQSPRPYTAERHRAWLLRKAFQS